MTTNIKDMKKKMIMKFEKMSVEQIKNAIFALRTRRLGTFSEMLVQHIISCDESRCLSHDLSNGDTRIEVKFGVPLSKVNRIESFKTESKSIKMINLLQIANEKIVVPFSHRLDYKFMTNIEQVKKSCFELLYYGLFFFDKIVIFKILQSRIASDIGFSDKQHRGNKGEGQFLITEKNIDYHYKNFLFKEFDYYFMKSMILQEIKQENV